MNGGERVAEVLRTQGVKHLFALCGGHISPILVASKRVGIGVIDVRDEANAVFAADAASRLTGIPGVAAVTAGPGVTNAITPLKNAQLAQSPLVLIGGATATVLRGRGALQDIDQMALVRPHVKWTARPNTLREVIPALEEAFRVAKEGTPGPVFVELAVDLLYDEATIRSWYEKKTEKRSLGEKARSLGLKLWLTNQFLGSSRFHISPPAPDQFPVASAAEIESVASRVRAAKKPVMVLGSQTLLRPGAIPELVASISTIGVPVYLSGMARGLVDAKTGLVFRHHRKDALRGADLIILCGVPLDFRLDYGGQLSHKATYIAVNRNADELAKNRRPDLALHADATAFLLDLARAGCGPAESRDAWLAELRARDEAREAKIDAMAAEPVSARGAAALNPIALCRALNRHVADDSVMIGDGGDFVATAAYATTVKRPLSWLDPGVFGTLGVGAGFAFGAKATRPTADVWLIWGDGAAGFSISELDTMVRHKLPVIAVIGNDAGWTQIARDQVEILGDACGTELAPNRYDLVAEAWGAKGLLLDDPAKVDEVLAEAVRLSRAGHPVVVNAIIGKTDFRKGSISM